MKTRKHAKDSLVIKTEMVLPNDTNPLNNLMGGRMMHLMDVVSAISAQKHSNHVVVTASVDNVSFSHPIKLGSVVTMESKITRAFSSSMEIHIKVWAEDFTTNSRIKSNEAFFTFVAVDNTGRPVEVPEVIPETDEEKELYDSALRRRQLRLILAGRLQPSDATELKNLFSL
ncbi:acyl-CoA thioesterase [Cytophagaceae bacterium ABcell3]|nr:acyl-CoA thioesterase [Cytophagaceae bacterium ABcell3]